MELEIQQSKHTHTQRERGGGLWRTPDLWLKTGEKRFDKSSLAQNNPDKPIIGNNTEGSVWGDPHWQTHKTHTGKAVRARPFSSGFPKTRNRNAHFTNVLHHLQWPPRHPVPVIPKHSTSPGLLHSLPSVTPHTPNSISHGLLLPWQLHFPEASSPGLYTINSLSWIQRRIWQSVAGTLCPLSGRKEPREVTHVVPECQWC